VIDKDWETKNKPRLILTVQSLSAVGIPFKEAAKEGIRVSDHYEGVTSVGQHARLIAAVGGWYSAAVAFLVKRIRMEEGDEAAESFIHDMKVMTEDCVETGTFRIRNKDKS